MYTSCGLSADGAAALRDAVVSTFDEYNFAGLFVCYPAYFENADHVIVIVDQGHLIGILSGLRKRVSGHSCIHIALNFIDPRHRRRGMIFTLWEALFRSVLGYDGRLPELITASTFNPSVYASLRTTAKLALGSFYPDLAGVNDGRLLDLIGELAEAVAPGAEFDSGTGVLRQMIPRDFYDSIPTNSKPDIYDYFVGHLEPGDVLLCTVHLHDEAQPVRLLRPLGIKAEGQVGHGPTQG